MRRALTALLALVLVAAAACSDDDASAEAEAGEATTTTAPADGAATDPDGGGDDDGEVPADEVVPGDDWVVADPEDHGLDPALLEEAREYAFGEGKNTQGVVVVHGGEIVAEWYADGADADSWAASWSMAKSVTSAALGVAVEEGLIPSVDESMATYIDGWAGTDREEITVRDVLQMSSGLDWDEAYSGTAGDSEIVQMVTGESDQLAYAASRPLEYEPGTHWSYSSGDTMLLSGVVEEATGTSLADYAQEVLFEPIGMEPLDWWQDAEGQTLGYCCVDTTSRDFARLGLLYLRGGRWGDQQVVPQAWVEDSLEPAPAAPEGEYGYQWWLYDDEGLPEDHFAAQGHDGQFIDVFPSLDLVVVRNGTYVKSDGPPVADPTLFAHYPSDGIVPGQGTTPPDEWDASAFLGPIVTAAEGS